MPLATPSMAALEPEILMIPKELLSLWQIDYQILKILTILILNGRPSSSSLHKKKLRLYIQSLPPYTFVFVIPVFHNVNI